MADWKWTVEAIRQNRRGHDLGRVADSSGTAFTIGTVRSHLASSLAAPIRAEALVGTAGVAHALDAATLLTIGILGVDFGAVTAVRTGNVLGRWGAARSNDD